MGKFSEGVNKWAYKTNKKLDLIRRKIIIELSTDIVINTPVKTGKAKNNWHFELGVREEKIIESATYDKTGRKVIAEIIKATKMIEKNEQPAFITNNLPYIIRLENGYSHQAPNGMVKRAVKRFNGLVKEIVANDRE